MKTKAENVSYYKRLHGIASLKTFFYPHNFLNLIQISIHYKKNQSNMKDNSFEKTERAKHRKKQTKNT